MSFFPEKLPIPFDGQKETIDWRVENERKTWLAHILIQLICSNDKEYWAWHRDRIMSLPAGHPGLTTMEVELKLDGVPVRLSHVVDRLGEDFENVVRRAAKELVRDKFSKIENMLTRVERAFKDEFPELNWGEDEY